MAQDPVEAILRGVGASDAEAAHLVPLRSQGPALFERLFGERPHQAKVYRLANRGSRGVQLQTVENGSRTLFTNLRWVAEFAVAVAAARGNQGVQPAGRARRRTRARSAR